MGVLDDKLLELYEKDEEVKAALDATGSVTMASKDQPAKIDLSLVDGRIIGKAKAHIHLDVAVPEPFEYHGIRIHVESIDLDGDRLRVALSANCPTYGPYLFGNPPLQVGRTGVDDAAAALVEMIGQAVEMSARHHGWGGRL